MLQRYHTNHLIAHLKAKNKKLYPKQKIVKKKNRAEIIKTNKQMNKSTTQSCFYEKTNKLDTLSFRVIKRQREVIQINKIRDQKGI